ncbi:MAG: S8 family serine peptidase [Candidatus Cloacimonadia bacterium]
MKLKYVLLLLLLATTLSLFGVVKNDKISEELSEIISIEKNVQDKIPVMIVLKDQYDTQKLYSQAKILGKKERREYAMSTLKKHSDKTQANLRQTLKELEDAGAVSEVTYNWIVNTIGLTAESKAIKLLAERSDVDLIYYDPLKKMIPDPINAYDLNDQHNVEREVTWNLTNMNVPEVWELGYQGEGVLVSVIDTGINYEHHDIKDRMWVHEDYPNHGWSFIDNSSNTKDVYDHGTHCAGSIAGDGTSGRKTGVAPKSRIMSVKIFTDEGKSTEQVVLSAIEFSLEYGADIMNMSFGWSQKGDGNRPLWRQAMTNVLSVGVISIVISGNEAGELTKGLPVPYNVRIPGDCPPPWLHPHQTYQGGLSSVVCIGAVNKEDKLANFSSVGPVTWQDETPYFDYPLNPGIGLIRPDVCAPGVDVISLANDNNTGYSVKSGTSMAAPNTAGVVALLLSKDPELTPEDISRALELTVYKIIDRKGNLFGSGRVDALAAINYVVGTNTPNKVFHPYPAINQQSIPTLTTLRWYDGGGTDSFKLYLGTDNPPTNLVEGAELTDIFYEITEPLDFATQYYWRVDSVNEKGITAGDLWSFISAYQVSENFEEGSFSHPDWLFTTTGGGSEKWFVDENEAFVGEKSAKSGQINHNGTTTMNITLDVLESGVIKFAKKTSTEEGSDYLRFYVGNDLKGEWSGELDWSEEVFHVSRGMNTFRWIYSKDQLGSGGDDAVWVDEIVFPKHPKPPVAYAPKNITTSVDFESYTLGWELDVNENIDPIAFLLYGYDLYGRSDQEDDYVKLNDDYITDNNITIDITEAGAYSYYLVAAYRVMGKLTYSEMSEVVTVVIHPPLEIPLFSPAGGEYNAPVEISFEISEGSNVYYTIDGTEPDLHSDKYIEPFMIEESTTVKARAYKLSYLPGEIGSEYYEIVLTSVEEEIVLPIDYALKLYPNPYSINSASRSNNLVSISYALPEETNTLKLNVYNIKGQLVKSFAGMPQERGVHTIHWELDNTAGKSLSNGIYLMILQTDKKKMNNKFIVVQ